MDKKLVQFQVVVRLRQEEAAAKALKKAVTITVASVVSADLVALSGIIIYGALWILFLRVLFLWVLFFECLFTPQQLNPLKI